MKFLRNLVLVIIAIIILGGVAIAILYQNKNKEKTEFTNDVRKNSSGNYVTLSEGQTHYEADGQDSGKVVISMALAFPIIFGMVHLSTWLTRVLK